MFISDTDASLYSVGTLVTQERTPILTSNQLEKGVYVNKEYRFSVYGQLKSCTVVVQRPGTITMLVSFVIVIICLDLQLSS